LSVATKTELDPRTVRCGAEIWGVPIHLWCLYTARSCFSTLLFSFVSGRVTMRCKTRLQSYDSRLVLGDEMQDGNNDEALCVPVNDALLGLVKSHDGGSEKGEDEGGYACSPGQGRGSSGPP
jgi:hypothetical protein